MDVLLSAVANDLVGRLVSFLIGKCQQEPGATDDSAVRLRRLLIRARAVVEEAEGRQIANWAMLMQLNQLRRELCRATYVLDDLGRGSVTRAVASGFRPLSHQPTPGTGSSSGEGIGVAVESLEAALSDKRELVVLLGACPRVTRQPYSAYLFMENCMFGRPAHQDLAVLPIIGPHDVGKRTLVEHVCLDERVREHFTEIHRLMISSSDDLDLLATSRRDHRNLTDDAAIARSLFVIDLADGAAGECSWRRLRASRGIVSSDNKVIIISRTETHSALGTFPPLRLRAPRRAELWYLFRNLAFGGADPAERPDLLRLAAALFNGFFLDFSPFTTVHNLGAWLRGDMTARAWRRVLDVSAAGTLLRPLERELCFLCRPVVGGSADGAPLLFCDRRKATGVAGDELPGVTMLQLATGGAAAVPVGKTRFDVLVWRSRIPPFASYVVACDVERAWRAVAGEVRVRKRKRGQQHDMNRRRD